MGSIILGGDNMELCITSGNYHIFLLMLKSHSDQRIIINTVANNGIDLLMNVSSDLNETKTIDVLYHELKLSPFKYLCPCFKIIPATKEIINGFKNHAPINYSLSLN